MLDVLVVLVTDVLHEIPAGTQRSRELDRERLLVGARIDHGRDVLQLTEARSRVTLDRMQLLGVRMANERLFVFSSGV